MMSGCYCIPSFVATSIAQRGWVFGHKVVDIPGVSQMLISVCDNTIVLLFFPPPLPHVQTPFTLSTPSHVTLPICYGTWSTRINMLATRVGGLGEEDTQEQVKKF